MRVGTSRTTGALLAAAALFAVLHIYRTIQVAAPRHRWQAQQHKSTRQLDPGDAATSSRSGRGNANSSNSSIRSAQSSSDSSSGSKGSDGGSSSKGSSSKGSARRSRSRSSGSKPSSAVIGGLKESANLQSRKQANREEAQKSVYAAICLVVKGEIGQSC